MNLQRGLFRVWAVGSGFWIGYAVWRAFTDCVFKGTGFGRLACVVHEGGVLSAWSVVSVEGATPNMIGGIAATALVPPALTFLVGAAAIWAGRGFRRPASN
jgi:hypothetical protein